MLGERGLWFKKVFFDPAARVPLVIKPAPDALRSPVAMKRAGFPGRSGARRSSPSGPVMAAVTNRSSEPLRRDMTYWRAPKRQAFTDVISEIMSEGLADPVIMIRRGPPQVHRRAEPPEPALRSGGRLAGAERPGRTTAALPGHSGRIFRTEMARRWDFDALERAYPAEPKTPRAHPKGPWPGQTAGLGPPAGQATNPGSLAQRRGRLRRLGLRRSAGVRLFGLSRHRPDVRRTNPTAGPPPP